MNVPEVLHELIERVQWSSDDNKAEAHAAIEADMEPATAPAKDDPEAAPAAAPAKEGKTS